MSSKKKNADRKPPDKRAVPPADDPQRRGDAGRDGEAENDRAAAEARLKALKQVREMRRPDADDDPDTTGH